MTLDYFYGQSGELFSYFRIPKALFQDSRFRQLSTDARTLYGILLDRMSLSVKNSWIDEQGRVYIIYTVREVQESLCCAEHKAVKLFRELEEIDLIERKRRGLGRPSLIYVKDFTTGLSKMHNLNCANSNSGIHQYYCIATAASEDFGKLAYGVKKQMHNRLRNDLTRKGELKKGYIKDKYGKSSQLRFLHGRPVVPVGYVQSRNAQHKRKSVNKYTPEGRELIHKNLNIDPKTMLWLMRNPVQGRSIEYADNRISLYAAQHGKCAVTGEIMESHEIHCHHKKPIAKGGTDEYQNLVLVSIPVHKLIHASDKATIRFYLNLLNLDSTQISKLNKFREMAGMPLID